MYRLLLIVTFSIGVLLSGHAHAAGFDCKSAKTNVEHLICTHPDLSRLDDRLKAMYDQIEGETWGVDAETGDTKDPAGDELKKWRATVRDVCTDAACIKRAYITQIAAWRKEWADALPGGGQ